MYDPSTSEVTLYTSSWCAHAVLVERFLRRHDVHFHQIDIDGDSEARKELIRINNGYASVPTLLFPDGTKLTEPSLSQLRERFELESPLGLMDRIRAILGREDGDETG